MPLFAGLVAQDSAVTLPLPSVAEDMQSDYELLGTTLGPHPLKLLRTALRARRCLASKDLIGVASGRQIRLAGLVTGRQKPQTASGVIFVTLEDEFGMVNVVVWHHLAERQRRALIGSQLLQVEGKLESQDGVRHLIAGRLTDLTALLSGLDVRSRDFH